MVNFLGANHGPANADNQESMFNAAIGSSYPFDPNYTGAGNMNLRQAAANTLVSLPFILSVAAEVVSVDFWVKMVGAPTGGITVQLYGIGAGPNLPGGVNLATSGASIPVADLSTDYQRIKLTYSPTPGTLNASDQYFVVVSGTTAIDGVNYFHIATDTTPVGFMRGAISNGLGTYTAQTSRPVLEVFYLTTTRLSQGFIASGNQEIAEAHLWLSKDGLPTGNLYIDICEDVGGSPNLLAPVGVSSGAVSAAILTVTPTETIFTFATPVPITDGQRYHFVLSTNGTFSNTDEVLLDTQRVLPSYSNGTLGVYNGNQTWQAYDQDAIFELWYVEQQPPDFLADSLALLGSPPLDCHAQNVWLQGLVTALSSVFPNIIAPDFGGTGVGVYEVGDMLFASAPYHLERLTIGTAGQSLGITPAGLPGWGAGFSSVVVSAYNNTVAALTKGMLVRWDDSSSGDHKVSRTAMVADPMFAGAVQDSIPPGEYGPVVAYGWAQIPIIGNPATEFFYDTASSGACRAASFGPIRSNNPSLLSGAMAWCFINPADRKNPYFRASNRVAYNVQGTTLTLSTWTQVGLNTVEEESHPLLMGLSGNVIQINEAGRYRIRARTPVTGSGTVTMAMMKLEGLTGTVGDLAFSESPAIAAPAAGGFNVTLLEEFTVTAPGTFDLQVWATGSLVLRAGTMHNVVALNTVENVYTVVEIEKLVVSV